jgi:hypothetical protein
MYAACLSSPYATGGYLLQRLVTAHPAITPLMPGPGLGTVRVHTFLLRDGSVQIPSALIKIPALGAEFDNSRTGSVIAPVDVKTGVLGPGIGLVEQYGVHDEVHSHALTGAVFKGFRIPEWDKVLALVTEGARGFYELPALGWDVAVSPRGPIIIEANWEFSAFWIERPDDRGMAIEIRALFSNI